MSILSKTRTLANLGKTLLTNAGRQHLARSIAAYDLLPDTECPCCGFKGRFVTGGRGARLGAVCPRCQSMERHRLLAVAVLREFVQFRGKKILHFAPEAIISALVRRYEPDEYVTADIQPGRADIVLDLEKIALEDETFDLVIASHVLEHVDDRKAMRELYRVLRPGGELVAMVPLIDGWHETFEDGAKVTAQERTRYFGQSDHVRYYGADFRDRLARVGFRVSEFTSGPLDSVHHGMTRGSKVFLCAK